MSDPSVSHHAGHASPSLLPRPTCYLRIPITIHPTSNIPLNHPTVPPSPPPSRAFWPRSEAREGKNRRNADEKASGSHGSSSTSYTAAAHTATPATTATTTTTSPTAGAAADSLRGGGAVDSLVRLPSGRPRRFAVRSAAFREFSVADEFRRRIRRKSAGNSHRK